MAYPLHAKLQRYVRIESYLITGQVEASEKGARYKRIVPRMRTPVPFCREVTSSPLSTVSHLLYSFWKHLYERKIISVWTGLVREKLKSQKTVICYRNLFLDKKCIFPEGEEPLLSFFSQLLYKNFIFAWLKKKKKFFFWITQRDLVLSVKNCFP